MAQRRHITPSNYREAGVNILNLPSEILDFIYSILCLHCSYENAVGAPYNLIRVAVRHQSALSSLSRTCSRLRDHAQPVLFHAYYSEISRILPPMDALTSGRLDDRNSIAFRTQFSQLRRHINEKNRTYLFLRTLLDRPDLTICVRGFYGGDENTLYYLDTRSLMSRAPNLRVLVAPDCETSATPEEDAPLGESKWTWDLTFRCLTRLSTDCISCEQLREILKECPVLEDLEYYGKFFLEKDILSPEKHLPNVKQNLKRLCYSVLGDGSIGRISYELRDMVHGYVYPSWVCLPALETLEIERILLYGSRCNLKEQDDMEILEDDRHEDPTDVWGFRPSSQNPRNAILSEIKMGKTTPEDFLSRLPPSIKMLRIGQISLWPAMYRDAIMLAEQAPTRFPNLQELRLEVATDEAEDHVSEADDYPWEADELSRPVYEDEDSDD
ncbi:f-box domain protein [Colletotrichum sojae]|uniref:F-box domain protein n=1 Tax=Colletotrichum sojae TaxID=2175907 RepID=A0A8H6IUK6_9PEZI|nr:f-box domain protein [Colletotrichum sojae]